jgi:FMN-dependent NADH-azoreductase
MNLLHVDSSILGPASVSRGLSANIVDAWKAKNPSSKVIYRDLAVDPISHLNGPILLAAAIDASQHTPEISRELAVSAKVMAEFLAAEIIVIGAPMYNFGIPSQLKAWIDRLAVAGKTFTYTPQGPKGLAGGKTVIVASSRGGYYGAGTPLAAVDHQENYLKSTFGFLGITDIRFVRAEGVNISPETKQQAIAVAEQDALKAAA